MKQQLYISLVWYPRLPELETALNASGLFFFFPSTALAVYFEIHFYYYCYLFY